MNIIETCYLNIQLLMLTLNFQFKCLRVSNLYRASQRDGQTNIHGNLQSSFAINNKDKEAELYTDKWNPRIKPCQRDEQIINK